MFREESLPGFVIGMTMDDYIAHPTEHGYLVAGPGFWFTSSESRRHCLGREDYNDRCGIVEK